jgi:hypothetical protein
MKENNCNYKEMLYHLKENFKYLYADKDLYFAEGYLRACRDAEIVTDKRFNKMMEILNENPNARGYSNNY